MPKKNPYISLGIAALVIGHLIAAYTSFGFHHPDEHFQILEWANYFLGLAPDASHLPWEFASQIRPWFQPMVHAFFLKCFLTLGIYDPFQAAFFFRLVYAALNIWAVIALWKYFEQKYSLSPKWFFLISLIWFFPYLHVRTSSENLAGIFLCFALLTLLRARFLTAGLLFGFAFISRYQVALGLVGLAAVLLAGDRGVRKKHWLMLLGFLIPIGLGAFLDRWGYGNWVFTPYQYYQVNIVDNMAAKYNPYPWYQYFLWIAELNPLISLPLFYGVIRFCIRDRLNPFAGFTIAFFFLHCLILNKEYRFLFPVLNFVTFMAAAWFGNAVDGKFLRASAFVASYLVVNLLSFSISTLHGASTTTLWPVHAVYRNFRDYPSTTIWLSNRDYLEVNRGKYYDLSVVPHFKPHELHLFHSTEELVTLMQRHPGANILVDGTLNDPLNQAFVATIEASSCRLVTSAFPKILSEKTKVSYQAVYSCQKN